MSKEYPDIVNWEEEIEDAEDMLSEEFWKEQWYVKYITWPIGTAYRWLRELPYRVKYYRQRGQRCWSDQDAWAIDYWLVEGLIPMLERLKREKLGIPSSMIKESIREAGDESGVDILAEQRWDNILGEIIYGLKCAKKLQDMDYDYEDKKLTKRLTKSAQKSFTLIGKHLFNLWD
tara:strand:+ start:327 stop:851 length:525 start_codon:yes stop_codon:yes gene_type:complete